MCQIFKVIPPSSQIIHNSVNRWILEFCLLWRRFLTYFSVSFRFDLVDWTRQIFVDLAPNLYAEILDSFHSDRPLFLHEQRLVFLELLNDLDRVLGTSSHFMLGPWLESAKAVIPNGTDSQKALFEFNARNQITLWGPNGQILDYAAKQWAGLVSNYYAPRWDLFFGMLEHSLATGTEFDPSEFGSRFLSEIGIPFTLDRKQFPSVPKEDSVEVCLEMYEKWRPRLTFDHIKIHPNAIPNVKYWRIQVMKSGTRVRRHDGMFGPPGNLLLFGQDNDSFVTIGVICDSFLWERVISHGYNSQYVRHG